jgi:hypothetical protein
LEAPAGSEAFPQHGEGIRACNWLNPDDAVARITYANARTVLLTGLALERERSGQGPGSTSAQPVNEEDNSA